MNNTHTVRLTARRERLARAMTIFRSHGRRLRAWQHKLYEAPLMALISEAGVLLRFGSDGYDGGDCGYLLAATSLQIDALERVLTTSAPLDRDSSRWGCGERLDRVRGELERSGLQRVSFDRVLRLACLPRISRGRVGFLDFEVIERASVAYSVVT